jgi:uncharacterized protein with NRDE domain
MCIAAIAQHIGEYHLVLASNRDEWLARPSEAMQWWKPDGMNEILSGRDLEAGGTWLGLTRAGRFAMITNVRQTLKSQVTYPKSRGQLTIGWLLSNATLAEFIAQLNEARSQYAGYNLLFGDLNQGLHYFSNCQPEATPLEPGVIYGLSNASLDTPWPKVVALKAALTKAIATEDTLTETLKHSLLNADSYDGSPLSAINVYAPNFAQTGKPYGRRCSTVIEVSAAGEISVTEIQRDENQRRFTWQLNVA